MNFSFCMEMLYTDLPFLARVKAAQEHGVDCIEFWDYRDKDLDALESEMRTDHVRVTNFSGNRYHGMLDSY